MFLAIKTSIKGDPGFAMELMTPEAAGIQKLDDTTTTETQADDGECKGNPPLLRPYYSG